MKWGTSPFKLPGCAHPFKTYFLLTKCWQVWYIRGESQQPLVKEKK